ncbi:classical arabinogalactan protein 9-like [Panicum hallii]|jgi:hypothetical protein|uniref:classical arabinogalactan protein 9-like n=1 Tax=Panicum hallii TaxID=206008 RepID=UPI000DF4CB8C|nr:classical arabinogalactan protein 9-like [Panicum hallii]
MAGHPRATNRRVQSTRPQLVIVAKLKPEHLRFPVTNPHLAPDGCRAPAQLRRPPPPLFGQPVEPDLTPPPANTTHVEIVDDRQRRHWHLPPSLPPFARSHEARVPPCRAPPHALRAPDPATNLAPQANAPASILDSPGHREQVSQAESPAAAPRLHGLQLLLPQPPPPATPPG